MNHSLYILLAILYFVACSCNNQREQNVNSDKLNREELGDINRYLVEKDRERIQNYIERKNLEMTESTSGLWYQIIKDGSGDKFTDDDRIYMNYSCSLLDGTLCYSSEDLGPKEITLGRGELEAGLNEGLRMLRPGGEAIFILPPFLAYGLIGDENAIPPRSTIVYEVKILNKE
jgi:FKBP-type peptidyl-prolyl cis-trans isomerase FkpA